jgi:hypothetical protein
MVPVALPRRDDESRAGKARSSRKLIDAVNVSALLKVKR